MDKLMKRRDDEVSDKAMERRKRVERCIARKQDLLLICITCRTEPPPSAAVTGIGAASGKAQEPHSHACKHQTVSVL